MFIIDLSGVLDIEIYLCTEWDLLVVSITEYLNVLISYRFRFNFLSKKYENIYYIINIKIIIYMFNPLFYEE